jgi:bifunctional DNA primase/polymerase-like protein
MRPLDTCRSRMCRTSPCENSLTGGAGRQGRVRVVPDLTLAQAAHVFQGMAFHTIPTRPQDKALALRAGQRKTYERRRPTEQEVQAWWTREPRYNVALLLGPACRLLILNVNQKHGYDGLGTLMRKSHVPPDDLTPTILTPHGGMAYCFKPPDREQFPFPFKTHVQAYVQGAVAE